MDICNHTVGRVNICLERIPLLSSPSCLLCTLSGVICFSKNNCTPLFLPHYELHWKAACQGAPTLHSTGKRGCPGPWPSDMHHLQDHTGTHTWRPEWRSKGTLKKPNVSDPEIFDSNPTGVRRRRLCQSEWRLVNCWSVSQGGQPWSFPCQPWPTNRGNLRSKHATSSWWHYLFFFSIYLFYLFIFGCVGSSLLRTGFL